MYKQQRTEAASPSSWSAREAYLLAVVCLVVGLALGYLLRGSSAPVVAAAGTPEAATSAPTAGPTALAGDVDLQAAPLKAALTSDPRNFDLLVQLGNLYYDKQVFAPAIDYYQRALVLRPNEVNVRTDLGTAYWYSGSPHRALDEYKKSLKVDPGHAQTLFNMGIVYDKGMKDSAAAAAAWEKLLKLHPDYPERERVQGMLEQIRKRNS
jgi:cytochrome c-type biogenesis protein CcmH/NrfG